MKRMLAIAVVLMSAQAVDAEILQKREGARHNNSINPYGLEYVDLASVNCDELIGIAKKKTVIETSTGVVVAGIAPNCQVLHDTRYDFFEAIGTYIRASDGTCIVWGCEGRRDLGGDQS